MRSNRATEVAAKKNGRATIGDNSGAVGVGDSVDVGFCVATGIAIEKSVDAGMFCGVSVVRESLDIVIVCVPVQSLCMSKATAASSCPISMGISGWSSTKISESCPSSADTWKSTSELGG